MGIESTAIVYRSGRYGPDTFRSGDTISGNVVINISGHSSHKLSSVLLKVRGRAKTDWEDSDDDSYSETQDLFRLDIPLKAVTPGEGTSLLPGEHQMPFSFTLPARLPHSQKYRDAKVVYECKARAVSSGFWSRNGRKEVKWTVPPERDLSLEPRLAEPLTVRREDKWTLFGGNPGEFRATIPRQGYVAGDVIQLWLEGGDQVFSELAELNGEVKLKRLVLSRAGKKHTNEERTAVTVVRPGKSPSAWHHMQLTVPDGEITMDDETVCRIISVTYYVKVSDIHLPVTLGTIPPRPS